MAQTVQVQLPQKLIPVFTGKARYRCSWGGRGSGKTVTFAKMAAIRGLQYAQSGVRGIIACAREFMNSLDESSMAEVKAAILSEPWLAEHYDIGEKYIRTKDGRVEFKFFGLTRNIDSVKSKARILILWVDEAENVSEAAWRKVLPTVRTDNMEQNQFESSEIWVTWNPESEESSTHIRFRKNTPDNCVIVEMNYKDNPWFPDVLEQERLNDLKHRPDDYNHVWEGGFKTRSEAQIFKNYVVEEFDTPANARFYFGMDYGFANDPTTINRMFIQGKKLYLDEEAHADHLPIEQYPAFLAGSDLRVPPRWRNPMGLTGVDGTEKWPITCDSARPESIHHLKTYGFKVEPSIKGAKSVEEGVEFLRGFDIVIHPRCINTIREFNLYSYKVDKQTEEILPQILDENNHHIDAIRYALEKTRRSQRAAVKQVVGLH